MDMAITENVIKREIDWECKLEETAALERHGSDTVTYRGTLDLKDAPAIVRRWWREHRRGRGWGQWTVHLGTVPAQPTPEQIVDRLSQIAYIALHRFEAWTRAMDSLLAQVLATPPLIRERQGNKDDFVYDIPDPSKDPDLRSFADFQDVDCFRMNTLSEYISNYKGTEGAAAWKAYRIQADALVEQRRSTAAAEREAQNLAWRAQQDARAAAEAVELRACMDRLLTDPLDRERFAAGLMPKEEIREVLRADLWDLVHDFARYERMTPEGLGVEDVEFDVIDDYTGPLTRGQYEQLLVLRSAFSDPRWAIQLRAHRATWIDENDVEASVTRLSARVSTSVGGYPMSREYALPD